MQAASVTITSAPSCQNVPSLICATATRRCDVASRIRVETLARPARGPSVNTATSLCGLRPLNSAMRRT